MERFLLICLCYFFSYAVHASFFTAQEIDTLKANMLANITPEGAIMASPSRQDPDYYYDWTRDSAITMDLIETWYEHTQDQKIKSLLYHYVHWVSLLQGQMDPLPNQDILGEPKFYMPHTEFAGLSYLGPWGRPQNDGPALRAHTLIRFAQQLLKEKQQDYVSKNLYNNTLDSSTMGAIKKDLEYVAHHWQDDNFDLWEEVYGQHFFTGMVQRKALLEGAQLASELNDPEAAKYYHQQAQELTQHLEKFIDPARQQIQGSLAPHPGPQKTEELDSSIILGVLLGNTEDGFFAVHNQYVKNSLIALRNQFKNYPINKQHEQAILYGRYPGDTYDGYKNTGLGNPWFILTATIAEYYYTLAQHIDRKHQLSLFNSYIKAGDAYLALIKKYAPNLRISEQINLLTGEQQGAASLTWSYVSVLRAEEARALCF